MFLDCVPDFYLFRSKEEHWYKLQFGIRGLRITEIKRLCLRLQSSWSFVNQTGKQKRNLDKVRGWPSFSPSSALSTNDGKNEDMEKGNVGSRRRERTLGSNDAQSMPLPTGLGSLILLRHLTLLFISTSKWPVSLSASALSSDFTHLWAFFQWFLVHSASSSPSLTKYFHHGLFQSSTLPNPRKFIQLQVVMNTFLWNMSIFPY